MWPPPSVAFFAHWVQSQEHLSIRDGRGSGAVILFTSSLDCGGSVETTS
jgi:hypothetical protein